MRLSQEAKVTNSNELILIFEWQSVVPFIPTFLASYQRLFIRKCKTPSVGKEMEGQIAAGGTDYS